MRNWIDLFEAVLLETTIQDLRQYANQVEGWMDEDTVRAILEDYDSDSDDLAAMWLDSLLGMYRFIEKKGHVPIYRQMNVEDFDHFKTTLPHNPGLGAHWSVHPDIESPTWAQDQIGDVPVMIEGTIVASQIDWKATLYQNFEWPREGELIFSGDVMVERITNQDTDEVVNVNVLMKK